MKPKAKPRRQSARVAAAASSSSTPNKAKKPQQPTQSHRRRSPRKASLSSNGASPDKDAKKPPAEFAAFDVDEEAPHFASLLSKDYSEECYAHNDLIALQYELELMLGHAMDNLKRVHGELSFLKCGEYPKHDLDKRLLPTYTLFTDGIPTIAVDEDDEQGQPGSIYQAVPPELDDDDDNPNEWPPTHVPPRFWSWANDTFLAPLDAHFMREWKDEFMNPLSVDAMAPLLVNAPWKYRKTKTANSPKRGRPPRQRIASGESVTSMSSSGRGSKKGGAGGGGRRSSGHEEFMIPKTLPEPADLLPLFTELVDSYCEEKLAEEYAAEEGHREDQDEDEEEGSPPPPPPKKKGRPPKHPTPVQAQEPSPPSRRQSNRLHGKGEESSQCNGYSAKKDNNKELNNGFHVDDRKRKAAQTHADEPPAKRVTRSSNGEVRNGWVNGRKRESPGRASVESNTRKSPARAPAHETLRQKREREREEREREREREEREREERERQERLDQLKGLFEKARERLRSPHEFMSLGKRMMRELVESGVIPTSTATMMSNEKKRDMAKGDEGARELNSLEMLGLEEEKEEDDVLIDTEGREDPNEPMDDVSRELLKVQRRLLDTSKKFRSAATKAWRKLKADFAYHETNAALNAAEDDLFSIAEHYYCPRPLRMPKPQEIPVLQAALARQLVMGKMHYGPHYRHCIPIYPEDRKVKKEKKMNKLKQKLNLKIAAGKSGKHGKSVKKEAPMSPRSVKCEPMSP